MEQDDSSESERVRTAVADDWSALLQRYRARLRRMVALRLDRGLQGCIDHSDVLQETFVEAAAGLKRYVERKEPPSFLWLRWLAGMKLNELHRKHLGFQLRDASRDVSIDRAPFSAATSAVLADKLLGRMTSACKAVA